MSQTNTTHTTDILPIRNNLNLLYSASIIIVLLMALVSAAGIVYQDTVYPSQEHAQSFVANDVVTLVIGVPILLGSMWLTRRGKVIGLLFWPGALFFLVYNYITYVLAMPLDWALLVYMALLVLSLYTMIALLISNNGKAVQEKLTGNVPEKLAGGVLAGLGAAFLLFATFEMVAAINIQEPFTEPELALHVADFLITPTWIIGGVLLWRKKALGYVSSTGLLFQASMLFIGLLMIMLLGPWLTGVEFNIIDFGVIILMGLICFVPFGLFVRGVLSNQTNLQEQ